MKSPRLKMTLENKHIQQIYTNYVSTYGMENITRTD